MAGKTVRNMVHIDEEKCNGCGACTIKCAEGALKIIDGKARLISDQYCDGLGACLGECPEGAITIEQRPAEEFNEEAVHSHLHEDTAETVACGCPGSAVREFANEVHGCPGSAVRELAGEGAGCGGGGCGGCGGHETTPSELTHWPIQMTLVPPTASFLKGADILLVAQCAGFASPSFHKDFLKGRALLIACPKLDNFQAHLAKLTEIVRVAKPASLTVVHMEVPCCSGLMYMAQQAIEAAGTQTPLNEVVMGVQGEILEESICS